MSHADDFIVLGRYRLLELIGEGGMGKVYLAENLQTNARVVVKVMHERFMQNQKFHEMFEREMSFLRQFHHPNVVSLLDSGMDSEFGPCIVMEYLQGMPLSELLERQGRMTADRTGRLLVQLCAALQAACDRGIIHRDLKPSNLMILQPNSYEPKLKVLDFGLAKLSLAPHLSIDELRGSDRRIIAVGTPEYICPEQVRGNEVDIRSDLYSVGIILFEMMAGRRPFITDVDTELFEMHARMPPPSFSEVGIYDVPLEIEQIVHRCLAKYPLDRPQMPRDLALAFEYALGRELSEEDQQLLDSSSGAFEGGMGNDVPMSQSAQAIAQLDDPFVMVYEYQAWMPEKIAVLKLRGFLEEVHGEVLETHPGLVKVRFKVHTEPPAGPPPAKVLVWLGLAEKPPPPPEPDWPTLDIYMEIKDPHQPNLLSITAILQPGDDSKMVRKNKWRKFCDMINAGLCQHMIAQKIRGPDDRMPTA